VAVATALDAQFEAAHQKIVWQKDNLDSLLTANEIPLPDNDWLDKFRNIVRQAFDSLLDVYNSIKRIAELYDWLKGIAGGVYDYIPQWLVDLFGYDYSQILELGKKIFIEAANVMEAFRLLPRMLHDSHLWMGFGVAGYPDAGIENLASQASMWTKKEYTGYRIWQGESAHDVYWNGRAADAYASAVDVQRPYVDSLVTSANRAASALRTGFTSGVSYYGNVLITIVRAGIALASVGVRAVFKKLSPADVIGELVTVLGWFASAYVSDVNLRGVESTQTDVLLSASALVTKGIWPDPTGSGNWPVLSADGRRIEYRDKRTR
jgi:hypothetical protein